MSFTYPLHNGGGGVGRGDVGLVVTLTDADGHEVARRDRDVRLFVDPDATLAELPVRFGEPGLGPATARVTDRVTGIETEAETVAFRVR